METLRHLDGEISDAVTDRFLRYVRFDTESFDNGGKEIPSSPGQMDLAKHVVEEADGMGIEGTIQPFGVELILPATVQGKKSTAFTAHLDKVAPGNGVKPIVHDNYDGRDLVLDGRITTVREFPDLAKHIGKTVITSDGTTVLGADDCAGLAEIMTAFEVIKNYNLPHGELRAWFTFDEETSLYGAQELDNLKHFVDAAYPVDGSVDTLGVDTFNARNAFLTINPEEDLKTGYEMTIRIKGKDVFPGYAKADDKGEGGMVDPFRSLPLVLQQLTQTGRVHATTSLSGNCDELELKVLLGPNEITAKLAHEIFKITLPKVKNPYNAAEVEVVEDLAFREDVKDYDLTSVSLLLDSIDYSESAEQTSGYDPYIQPYVILPGEGQIKIFTLLRAFEDDQSIEQEARMLKLSETFGDSASMNVKFSYGNIRDVLAAHPQIRQYAEDALRMTGMEPNADPTRGGTEGAVFTLSREVFKGEEPGRQMPGCNLPSAEKKGAHSKHEWVGQQTLVDSTHNIINLARIYGVR
jgi:di/tripeptidase